MQSSTDLIKLAEIMKKTEAFVVALNAASQHANYTYSIDSGGQKYIRIVQKTKLGTGRSVHCFIDAATGDILKAASWKAPAKGARGNLDTIDVSKTDPYTRWLYLR